MLFLLEWKQNDQSLPPKSLTDKFGQVRSTEHTVRLSPIISLFVWHVRHSPMRLHFFENQNHSLSDTLFSLGSRAAIISWGFLYLISFQSWFTTAHYDIVTNIDKEDNIDILKNTKKENLYVKLSQHEI